MVLHWEYDNFNRKMMTIEKVWMNMKKKGWLAAVGMACLTVFFAVACGEQQLPNFADYDNTAVLGASSVPSSTRYQQRMYSVNGNKSQFLTVQGLSLSGMENVLQLTASEDVTASLKCTYQSLKGSFKLVYASDGKATTIFDSDRCKSGSVASVSFPKGVGNIRLVGKPAYVQNLTVTWVNIDRTKLHMV